MIQIRRTLSPAIKAKVAFESLKEDRTIAELASEFKVPPNQISTWKKHFQEHLVDLFAGE